MKSRARSVQCSSTVALDRTRAQSRRSTRNSGNDEDIEGEPTCKIEFQSARMPEGVAQQNGESMNNNAECTTDSQQQRRKVQFDALHQEMELVSYSVSATGQSRRIVPRHLSKERTKKRRLVERLDRSNEAKNNEQVYESIEPSQHRKIRGPKAAGEEHIVEASLVFGTNSMKTTKDAIDENSGDENDDDEDVVDLDTEEPKDYDVDDEIDEDFNDEQEEEDDDAVEPAKVGESKESEVSDINPKEIKRKKRCSSATKFPSLKRKRSSRLQRLKNFKSTRMAEKHGAALGAHIQGKSDIAIKKLKQIAASAPLAPQIYSSLGMVYEDLLLESQRTGTTVLNNEDITDISNMEENLLVGSDRYDFIDQNLNIGRDRTIDDPEALKSLIGDKSLRDQLILAKRAYGSYHVAAILYKRDYSLWLRAADSAFEIATVHTTIMQLPNVTNEVIEYHRTEKSHWLNEAKDDYQAADNLNPPGIEIPAKLAHAMIELGMLSEALTLLTGLKNQVEFNGSYRAWLLFADLMLRIGHECNQWNAGIQTNSNKMFRRWLRKWSVSFDWKERRLQALAKAVEAACGSVCCQELMTWVRIRINKANDTASPETTENCAIEVESAPSTPNALDDHPISSYTTDEIAIDALPLTASCNTVYSISSELIRHMLDMRLYYGGKLVGDCVSLYLKEREVLSTSRTKKKAEFDNMQKRPISLFAMQRESYDIDEDDHCVDSDFDLPLSDDEDWDNNAVTVSLRKGTLPPELRFLYGLCLIEDYVNISLAVTCIQSINLLPLEAASFFQESVVDCGVFPDSDWMIFSETMARPFGLLTALSFVTDTLRSSNIEESLSKHLTLMYSQIVASVYENEWPELVLNTKDNVSDVSRYRRDQLIAVLLAAERYNIQNHSSSDDKNTSIDCMASKLTASITKISKLITATWKVHLDGSLSSICVDEVDSLSYLLHQYVEYSTATSHVQDTSPSGNTIDQLFNVVSIFCGSTAPINDDLISQQLIDLSVSPINSSWLTNDLESLSKCVFNLCVGINASHFSGWLLGNNSTRSKAIPGTSYFFGVTADDGPISGYIPEFVERAIIKAWDKVDSLYPGEAAFDFERKLGILKSSDRYKGIRARYVAVEQEHHISQFSEDKGLLVLINFAYVCLTCDNAYMSQERLRSVALSILLPATQFLLKETLWDANVGCNVADVRVWLDVSKVNHHDHVIVPSQRPGYIRPSKRQLRVRPNSNGEKSINEWFSWEDGQRPKSNLFNIPLSNLARLWHQSHEYENSDATISANGSMENVNVCMEKLRQCYSIQSAERLSVIIATSLLKLLECPTCRNPFAVIQLATMFASQGPKGGTSDQLFRAKLPTNEECTTQDALLILGRAECMNAIHYCPEAAFLCSYVANVCRLKCAGDAALQKSNRRWLTLSILAYDLSVIIRIMAKSILRNSDKREDSFGSWTDEVVDWFYELKKMNKLRENLLSDEAIDALPVAGASLRTILNDSLVTGIEGAESDDISADESIMK